MLLLFPLCSPFDEEGNIICRKLLMENFFSEIMRETVFCSILGFFTDDYKNKPIFKHSLNISSTEIQLDLHICQYILSIHIPIYLLK